MKKNKKVLVVDDDKLAAGILVKRLTKEGYEVYYAQDGERGLDLAFSKHPDIVLLDIIMPGKHGVEVMNSLKQDKWGKNIPVIVLSNYPTYPGLEELTKEYEYEVVGKDGTHIEGVVVKVNEYLS